MYWSLRHFRLALIAALLAMLAAALVPPVMQMLNPVPLAPLAAPAPMSDCGMPGMTSSPSPDNHADGNPSGSAQSCPLCSLFCHIPALPGPPQLALLAPFNVWLVLLPQRLPDWPLPLFVTPPARAPPANRFWITHS
ncbi:DUF2946 family protein [Silvimonas iriomotensis]|uniref:DUF2946 family protein n=1 Tax=Silvimonas iriomotensis TaxID=449662 RepID=A0ABQ2P778_9NEIS|nr:DUF2946 family protein [Silvimonas iriomotensis]GGP19863.1 hypothetical protein GCM10010970_12720 [Silvimonas iriomotensis]